MFLGRYTKITHSNATCGGRLRCHSRQNKSVLQEDPSRGALVCQRSYNGPTERERHIPNLNHIPGLRGVMRWGILFIIKQKFLNVGQIGEKNCRMVSSHLELGRDSTCDPP